MRIFVIILILFSVTAYAQSGRVAPGGSVDQTVAAAVADEPTVKQLFDEVNGYIRAKGVEFDAKKIAFTERLFDKVRLEQRQLAAKYAAMARGRKDLAGDDFYYIGMLHWIAENLDGTVESLREFISADTAAADRRQSARSIAIVVLAKQKKLDAAEAMLAEYLRSKPTKLTERSRMEGELAKAYQSQKDFARMLPHAEECYKAAKAILSEASSRTRGLDEILDAGMLVYEANRDGKDTKSAEDALDDIRITAANVQSPSLYYYAVDQKIKHLIETGRKAQAMAFYSASLISAAKDFSITSQGSDVLARLKKREKQYKLLGEPAPEMLFIDQWFPGERKTFAELKGKVVLLDFWATWCIPCFEAFPSLKEWHQDLSQDGLEILGITRYYGTVGGLPADIPAEIDYLKKFRKKEVLPYDFVVAKDQTTQMLFAAGSLPTAVLIDRKGVIRYIESGTSSTRLEQMRQMIIKLLAEK